jgi:hypothetical protein
MTTRTLTRAELHTLVWTHPPREAARRLGVTPGELDRLLQVMAAPYPYSGYWSAPASAARAVPRLPNPPPGAVEAVEITPAAPPPRKPMPSRPEPTDPPTAAPAQARHEKPPAPAAPVQVPARLSSPHRIIAARIAEQHQQDARRRAMGMGRAIVAESALTRRIRRIEDLLYKAVEARGHKVEVERASLYRVRFVVAGQDVTYAIRERYRLRREPLSKAEAAEPWNTTMNRTHRTVRVMTGVLALTLDGAWPRPQWEDKADRPLESQVEAIVDGAEKVSRAAAARDAERRESQRLYHEAERRREAARQAALAEEARWRRFLDLADAVEQARRGRALLAAMEAELVGQDGAESARAFLDWARTRLDRFDPLALGAVGVMASVGAAGKPIRE